MIIVAIDASKNYGAVSRSVEAASLAAEAAGATVHRVMLRNLEIRTCTSCSICQATGVCKIQDDLPELARLISQSNGIIFGTPDSARSANDATRAIFDRLGGYFSSGQMRLPEIDLKTAPHTNCAKEARRAIIITACKSPDLLATFFGYSAGPIRQLRSTLHESGIRTIGTLEVRSDLSRKHATSRDAQIASSFGRMLAGKI